MSKNRTLVAILASPPQTSGNRTLNMLRASQQILGIDEIFVVNLCTASAADLPALTKVANQWEAWLTARATLSEGLAAADAVLAAWGLSGLYGKARQHKARQLEWLVDEAAKHGHERAWTIGGEPRHPSRWHQYVSDKHGRTSGGSDTASRLAEVLREQPLRNLVPPAAEK